MFVLRSVSKLLSKSRLLVLLFFICLVAGSVYSSLSPLSFKFLIDGAFIPKDAGMFWLVLLVLLGGGVIAVLASLLGERVLALIAERALYDLRHRLFDHMTRQSVDFHLRFNQGTLMSRLTSDLSAVDQVISGVLPGFLHQLIAISIGLFLLIQLEWRLALLLGIGFLVLFLSPNMLRKQASRSALVYRETHDEYVGIIDELTKGYRVIRGLNLAASFMRRVEQMLRAMFTAGFRVTYIYALLDRIPLLVFILLNGGVIACGGYLIIQDDLSIGSFIAFYTIFLNVGQSVSSFAQTIPELIRAEVSFKRIAEILDYKAPLVRSGNSPLNKINTGIQFRRVSFGYHDHVLALNNVTFDIEAGKLTAFVGSSGSGKSTALQLLMRFYDPQQGDITIDGTPINELGEEHVRNLIGVVFQDSFLFNLTIEENIRMTRPEASEEEVIAAAKAAQIHDYIMSLPDQYKTQIKEFGGNLSGGQRQRLTIARALIKRPQLLLLDEITSALDPSTEAEINTLINSLRGKQTIVTVTHRLASIVTADRIIVFQNGKVVEIGTHDELLHLGGVYREMWEKQNGFLMKDNGLTANVTGQRLSRLPFFKGIPLDHLDEISSLFVTEKYDQDQWIIRQNEPGEKFYIIVRGSVSVMKQGVCVAVLEDGDHFGEIALLRNVVRTADVITRTPTVVLSLRRDPLLEIIENYPAVRQILEQSLKDRVD